MILAGTGHRPDKLGWYSPNVAARLKGLASVLLAELQPAWVLSGMALGWDQALAGAALAARIPLAAVIPFEGQELRWPAESQATYRKLRAEASWEVVTSGAYSADAMHARNRWMVDNATHVLALWSGAEGGTAHTVRYAERVGRPVVNAWARWTA